MQRRRRRGKCTRLLLERERKRRGVRLQLLFRELIGQLLIYRRFMRISFHLFLAISCWSRAFTSSSSQVLYFFKGASSEHFSALGSLRFYLPGRRVNIRFSCKLFKSLEALGYLS